MCNESWKGNEAIRDEFGAAAAAGRSTVTPMDPLNRTLMAMREDIEALRRQQNKLAVEISNLKERR